ncbi:hypothetical protein [Sphingobacterium allocomposti]|uniref:hypothetical protein n=1 Tax=Sphingobacterium allocomposti TaxID=415956 RepID=UPI001B882B65|nr:hypothetical protein [Sphingobacterium composti Yoo et al. 2007 non Ten et al. 2007]
MAVNLQSGTRLARRKRDTKKVGITIDMTYTSLLGGSTGVFPCFPVSTFGQQPSVEKQGLEI